MMQPLSHFVIRVSTTTMVVVASLAFSNIVIADAVPLVETTDFMQSR